MRILAPLPGRQSQSGVTMLETLIAMLVLSVGMLAYAGLQSVALKQSKMAQFRGGATQVAADYVARMRANADTAATGSYQYQVPYAELAGDLDIPGCVAVCTAQEIAAIDLANWRNITRRVLPGGTLFSVMDGAVLQVSSYDFWVMWRDPDVADATDVGVNCPAAAGVPTGVQCQHFRFTL